MFDAWETHLVWDSTVNCGKKNSPSRLARAQVFEMTNIGKGLVVPSFSNCIYFSVYMLIKEEDYLSLISSGDYIKIRLIRK